MGEFPINQGFIMKNRFENDGIENCNGDYDKMVREITVI